MLKNWLVPKRYKPSLLVTQDTREDLRRVARVGERFLGLCRGADTVLDPFTKDLYPVRVFEVLAHAEPRTSSQAKHCIMTTYASELYFWLESKQFKVLIMLMTTALLINCTKKDVILKLKAKLKHVS